jgi:thioredoxin 1
MSNGNTISSKKSMALKVFVPIIILCIIGGIWFVKNTEKDAGSIDSAKSSATAVDNPDFELHVTEKIDIEKLKSYGLPIIIDFGADSCIPCKQMAPVLKELNAELKGKAIIRFVDVWKYQELAQGYPINLIPTQIFIDATGKPYNPKDPEGKKMRLHSSRGHGEHNFTSHEGGMSKVELLEALKEMGMK